MDNYLKILSCTPLFVGVDIAEIEQLLKELIKVDYESKNGLIDLEIGLKTVLCKNC